MPGIDPMRLETHRGRASVLLERVVAAEEEVGLAGFGMANFAGLEVDGRLPVPQGTPILIVWVVEPCPLGPLGPCVASLPG